MNDQIKLRAFGIKLAGLMCAAYMVYTGFQEETAEGMWTSFGIGAVVAAAAWVAGLLYERYAKPTSGINPFR